MKKNKKELNKTHEQTAEKKKNSESGENAEEPRKKSFFKSTAFLLILSVIAFAGVIVLIVSVAFDGGLSWGNLTGSKVGKFDYKTDSLDNYIEIKESDYKDIVIDIPMQKPGAAELEAKKNELIATYRKGPVETTQTWFTKEPLKIGHDVLLYYMAYTLDEDGRKMIIPEACNHTDGTTYRYTLGKGKSIFGEGFDEALVGKLPIEGGIGEIRDTAYTTEGCVLYATVSFILDNGILYDNVDVCIDPTSPDFESAWGIGAEELFMNKLMNSIVLTGDRYETYELAGGGKITYTHLTVNYVTKSENAPLTVESTFTGDYSVEELRGKDVYYDVYIEKSVAYNVYEFNEEFLTEKLGYTEEKYKDYEGSSATEKYESYIMKSLTDTYNSYCKSYAEQEIWRILKSNIKIKMYPQDDVDEIYLYWEAYYTRQLAAENAAGAGYEDLDEYMAEIFELGEGGEWTSVLLASVKETVKERLIVYAILRDADILPVGEEFDKIYEEELLRDFNYANSISPGKFATIEDYKEYIANDKGEEEYIHDVYYYYATDKLYEMAELKYPE